jgi:hypothetical protein
VDIGCYSVHTLGKAVHKQVGSWVAGGGRQVCIGEQLKSISKPSTSLNASNERAEEEICVRSSTLLNLTTIVVQYTELLPPSPIS